jgi:hypothetical protein
LFSKTSAEVSCETEAQKDLGGNAGPDRPNSEDSTLENSLGRFKYLTARGAVDGDHTAS